MLWVIGYPSYVGGADTELWHVLRIWRRADVEVTLMPTWHAPADWRARCEGIGVQTSEVGGPDRIQCFDELRGSTVVSFCNGEFLRHADVFRTLGCRIIWVGCMSWMFPAERDHYARFGPFDAYVFQSDYQMSRLLPELKEFGVREDQCFRIPGGFDSEEFPLSPRYHEPETDFFVGRLARPDLDKWSRNTWAIYGAIPYARRRARFMGWDNRLLSTLGSPPEWAEVLEPCAESSRDFLAKLHCLMAINGGAAENWPRVGLEAMSAGVPIIAENQWGWREMIQHGKTGFLANNDQEFAYYAAHLAMNEDRRLEIVHNAREHLVKNLADPDDIWSRWKRLFDYVESLPRPRVVATGGNGHAAPMALEGDLTAAADRAWQVQATTDLASVTLRDAFNRGFRAGFQSASDSPTAGATEPHPETAIAN